MKTEYVVKYIADITPFTMDAKVKLRKHFLYYGNTQLTDKKCIKNVYVCNENGTLSNTGRHKIYCHGPVKEGDYLSTSEMYGTAVSIINKDFAFAIAVSDKSGNGKVGLVDAVFLQP